MDENQHLAAAMSDSCGGADHQAKDTQEARSKEGRAQEGGCCAQGKEASHKEGDSPWPATSVTLHAMLTTPEATL